MHDRSGVLRLRSVQNQPELRSREACLRSVLHLELLVKLELFRAWAGWLTAAFSLALLLT
ncbi:MAG: hypothetical protein QG637_1247, partial [Chloroflexota bacterium]|nr:hypothetical protein [Chloroflexota bacterium]